MVVFTIKETFNCFTEALKKAKGSSHPRVEESEVVKRILAQQKEQRITLTSDKMNLDYQTLYSLFDSLEAIGFISRFHDPATPQQRFLTWHGFGGFKSKYSAVMRMEVQREKLATMNPLERFMAELLMRILQADNKTILKTELEITVQDVYLRDVPSKDVELKKKTLQVLKRVLLYLGLVKKEIRTFQNAGEAAFTQMKGWRWAFPFHNQFFLEVLEDQATKETFQELPYLQKKYEELIVEIQQEPPKGPVTSFENAGFALFKGKNWRFYMSKLYCVIGRAPINYKKKNLDLKVVWHVDVDLGHLRKVSRQHALIAYNFEIGQFEIKCLSEKYPILVNLEAISFKDGAVPLQTKSIITISSESFFFLLPSKAATPPVCEEKVQPKQAVEVQ